MILLLFPKNNKYGRIIQLIHFISNIMSFIIIISIILYTLRNY
jgi:hypothetical protein